MVQLKLLLPFTLTLKIMQEVFTTKQATTNLEAMQLGLLDGVLKKTSRIGKLQIAGINIGVSMDTFESSVEKMNAVSKISRLQTPVVANGAKSRLNHVEEQKVMATVAKHVEGTA